MRLIDADALIDEANQDEAYGYVDAVQIANAPTIDAVPRKAFDGILWENDVMRKQLADIGVSFGAKMDDVVKVVRCKKCKWWVPNGRETPAQIPALGVCGYKWLEHLTMPCEFCFWGERNDNG